MAGQAPCPERLPNGQDRPPGLTLLAAAGYGLPMNMHKEEILSWSSRSRLRSAVGSAMMGCLLVIGLAAVTAGCRGGDPADPVLSRDQFVDLMVAIRRADLDTDTDTAYLARRAAVLDSAGVTDSALVHWVERHASDFAYMAAIWDSIDAKLSAKADTVR